MKIFYLTIAMLIATQSYACDFKDYECMKQRQIESKLPAQKYNDTQQRTYRYNERIYVNGAYDNSAVQLDDTYNHNIYIHAHNTNIRSNSGTGALVDINSTATHNKVTLDVSGNVRTDVRNMTSLDTCAALVCNRGSSSNSSGVKIRVNNATISTGVK